MIVSLIGVLLAVVFSVLLDGQLCVFEMSVARSHARALLHVVLAVAPGSPGFATVVAGIWFESEMHAQVVRHVAQLRHALWTVVAEVQPFHLACFLVEDSLPLEVLGKLFLGVVACDAI